MDKTGLFMQFVDCVCRLIGHLQVTPWKTGKFAKAKERRWSRPRSLRPGKCQVRQVVVTFPESLVTVLIRQFGTTAHNCSAMVSRGVNATFWDFSTEKEVTHNTAYKNRETFQQIHPPVPSLSKCIGIHNPHCGKSNSLAIFDHEYHLTIRSLSLSIWEHVNSLDHPGVGSKIYLRCWCLVIQPRAARGSALIVASCPSRSLQSSHEMSCRPADQHTGLAGVWRGRYI